MSAFKLRFNAFLSGFYVTIFVSTISFVFTVFNAVHFLSQTDANLSNCVRAYKIVMQHLQAVIWSKKL